MTSPFTPSPEQIEAMARAIVAQDTEGLSWQDYITDARAAWAIAIPVIGEEAAKLAESKWPRHSDIAAALRAKFTGDGE